MSPRPSPNLLPCDGEVYYFGSILPPEAAEDFFQRLQSSIAWRSDEVLIFGRQISTRRQVAWHGELPFAYTYSRSTKTALPWTEELQVLKVLAERVTGASYNACLLNLYPSGAEGVGWHSDDEKALAPGASIATLSLGAERRFCFRHKTKGCQAELWLEPGSLLEMRGETQRCWKHALPPAKRIASSRISLTFRRMLISAQPSLP
jgi:alkylated DNA repair dioxygenase AlkB